VNAAYSEGTEWMKMGAPAAKRIIQKLRRFLNGLYPEALECRLIRTVEKIFVLFFFSFVGVAF
jgi:hypothetical protein